MKKWPIFVAIGMMVLGVVLFVIVGIMVGFDFMKLDTANYVTNTYEITDAFHDIAVECITVDVTIRPSVDGKCRVVCYEQEKVSHRVGVNNGTLEIDSVDARNWVDRLGIFNFQSSKVTIYLPEGEFRSLKVDNTTGDLLVHGAWQFNAVQLDTTTGDIQVRELDCTEDLSIHVTTGDVTLTDVNCGNLKIDGSTGDVTMNRVVASDTIRMKMTTGDMTLNQCDAGGLYLMATTGDVRANLLTEKSISANTATGKVNVPPQQQGGICEINTTTGDIWVKIG